MLGLRILALLDWWLAWSFSKTTTAPNPSNSVACMCEKFAIAKFRVRCETETGAEKAASFLITAGMTVGRYTISVIRVSDYIADARGLLFSEKGLTDDASHRVL